MASDRIKALQIQAMRSVIKPDDEALYRYVCRWFSDKFSTPLLEVYDLPVDFVLQHYFEEAYEQMTPQERYRKAIELVETPAQRLERLRQEADILSSQMAIVQGKKKAKVEEEVKDKAPSALAQQIAKMFQHAKKKIAPATPEDPKVREILDNEDADALDVNQRTHEAPPAHSVGGGLEEDSVLVHSPSTDEPAPEAPDNNPARPLPPPMEEDLEFSLSEDDEFGDLPALGPPTKK